MSEEKTIYAKLEEELLTLALTEKQKSKLIKKLKLLRENKLNIMLVGATGCGKSSTINALFNCAELKVEYAYNQAVSKIDVDILPITSFKSEVKSCLEASIALGKVVKL